MLGTIATQETLETGTKIAPVSKVSRGRLSLYCRYPLLPTTFNPIFTKVSALIIKQDLTIILNL